MEINGGNRVLAIQNFELYVYDFSSISEENVKWIKSVACRFYNSRMHSLLQIAINKIILSLYDINIDWITFHEYNFVPFNANTPIRISYVLSGIVLNYASNNISNNLQETENASFYKVQLQECDEATITQIECSICYNTTNKINCSSFECKHEYCVNCVEELLNKKFKNCPYCREKIKMITCYSEENYNKLNK